MIIKKINVWTLAVLFFGLGIFSLQGMRKGDALVCGRPCYWSALPYEIQKKILWYTGLLEEYKCVKEIPFHDPPGNRHTFAVLSPSGEKWVSGFLDWIPAGKETKIYISSIKHSSYKKAYSYSGWCTGLAWDSSSDHILIGSDDTIRELDVKTGVDGILQLTGHGQGISYAVSPSKQKIARAFADRTIGIFKRDGSIVAQTALPSGEGNVSIVAWSSTGNRIICSRDGGSDILMYDKTLQLKSSYPAGGRVTSLHCSQEEIIAGYEGGYIVVWDRESGKPQTFSGHTQKVESLVSPSKGRIVSLSQDGTVKHWARKWKKPIRAFIFKGQKGGEIRETVNLLKLYLLEHYLSEAKAAGRKYRLTPEMVMYFKVLSNEMQELYKDTIEMP